jgi:hypothetical protein
MKTKIASLILLTLLTFNLNAEETIELKSVSIRGTENFSLKFNVEKTKFLSTPDWDGIAELPLSLKEAIKIAQAEVAKKNPDKKFSVDEIELRKNKFTDETRWYYIIEFDGDISKKDERVYILLDGSIVRPEIIQK